MNFVSYIIYRLSDRLVGPLNALPRHGQELTDLCSSCPRGLSFYFTNTLETANGQGFRRCVDPVAEDTKCIYRWNGARTDKRTGERKFDCKK